MLGTGQMNMAGLQRKLAATVSACQVDNLWGVIMLEGIGKQKGIKLLQIKRCFSFKHHQFLTMFDIRCKLIEV